MFPVPKIKEREKPTVPNNKSHLFQTEKKIKFSASYNFWQRTHLKKGFLIPTVWSQKNQSIKIKLRWIENWKRWTAAFISENKFSPNAQHRGNKDVLFTW